MAHSDSPKAQLWRRRLQQFENSSMTVAEFCNSVDCSVATFYHWKRSLEGQASGGFLQVQTETPRCIELQLPSGAVLRIPIEAIDTLPRILEHVA